MPVVVIIALALVPAGSGTATVSVNDAAPSAGISQPSKTWSANVGDANGDGWDDLLIVRHGYHGDMYLNQQDGTFALWQSFPGNPERPDRDRHDCDWADINADGRQDVYCSIGAAYGTQVKKNEVWIQGEDGHFVDRVDEFGAEDGYGRGRFVTFMNVNNDPYPDLFVGNIGDRPDGMPAPNRFFVNEGGTHFRDATEYGVTLEERAFCAEHVDIDQDGWEDLIVCSELWLRVYRNIGGTRFTNIASSLGLAQVRARPSAASFADFDRDGDPDIVMVVQGVASIRLKGSPAYGAPVFSYDTAQGRSVPVGDFDGDGDTDVLVVDGDNGSGGNAPDVLLLNDGTGRGWTVMSVPSPGGGIGDFGETIDYNHDGRADFVVLNGQVPQVGQAGPAQLFTFVDSTTPAITLTTPADGASHVQGATVNASYSCADELGGSGVDHCTGTVPNGSPIDTSTLGDYSFTVTAADNAGNESSVTHTYSVTEPSPDTTDPAITLTSPPQGATYVQGSTANASYACADEGGSGLNTCTGTVPNGSPIDTTTVGPKSFTVTAADNVGNESTVTHTYSVTAPATSAVLTVTKTGRGAVRSTDNRIRCGRDCSETYPVPTTVTLNATAAAGSVFVSWSGGVPAGCTTNPSCTLTVSEATSVHATFARAGTAAYQRAD